jgi:hypothetical protein
VASVRAGVAFKEAVLGISTALRNRDLTEAINDAGYGSDTTSSTAGFCMSDALTTIIEERLFACKGKSAIVNELMKEAFELTSDPSSVERFVVRNARVIEDAYSELTSTVRLVMSVTLLVVSTKQLISLYICR